MLGRGHGVKAVHDVHLHLCPSENVININMITFDLERGLKITSSEMEMQHYGLEICCFTVRRSNVSWDGYFSSHCSKCLLE